MTVDGVTARPHFEPEVISARAGNVVFFLENVTGPLGKSDHNMVIGRAIHQGLGETPRVAAGQAVTFTVKDLTPGTYLYWCSIKDPHDAIDHAAAGMVGTLTITP